MEAEAEPSPVVGSPGSPPPLQSLLSLEMPIREGATGIAVGCFRGLKVRGAQLLTTPQIFSVVLRILSHILDKPFLVHMVELRPRDRPSPEA